jgi:uncharacterized protein
MESQVESLRANGIYAVEQLPDNDSPVILLAHGINSDHTEDRSAQKPGLFDLMVDAAAQAGIGTVRFDFRGHGESAPVDGFVSIRSEVEDLKIVLNDARARGRQVFGVASASFGACATCAVLEEAPYLKSVVLLNPVLSPLGTFLDPGSEWARASINDAGLDKLKKTGSLMLDGDFPLGKDFIDDMRSFDPVMDLSNFNGAVSIVHGTADTYVQFEYSRMAAASLSCAFLPIIGSEHGFGVLRDRIFVAEEAVRFSEWAIGR